MAQLHQLEFSAVELELADRFTTQGRRLVATPGTADQFELYDGRVLPWARIEKILPASPLRWWTNLPTNRSIAQAHIWLGDKGFVVGGTCSIGRLFVVAEDDATLPSQPVVEFLADEPHRDLRNVLVHLDLISA